MNREEYIALFESLGFYCLDREHSRLSVEEAYNTGRILRHDDVELPTVYFNGNRHGVYFVVRSEQQMHFPSVWWTVIDPQKTTDDVPPYMTLRPMPGRERAAFSQLRS